MMRFEKVLATVLLSLLAVESQALEIVGLVEPHLVVKIGSPAAGIVDSIEVERGGRVEKGQTVARLKSRIEMADVNLANEKHVYLSGQYNRLHSLGVDSFASKQVVEQAQTEMRVAKLEAERQEILLSYRRVESPINGVVVKKILSPGEYVYEQTPLMVVAQIDPLNIEVLVPVAYFRKLYKGMAAWITLEVGADKPQLAKVIVIDKVMDPASSTVGVRLELPNHKLEIPAGQKCKVTFKEF